jgi:ankyrin repeat protein
MPFYYAALFGFSTVTRLLLDAGAEVNIQGGYYSSALQAAS